VLRIAGAISGGDCPAKHPRVVKLRDWNGEAQNAATRWRLRFGAVPCEQLRADF
jgi:hypothetical protein